MSELDSWRASWGTVRGEADQLSLDHPRVDCYMWRSPNDLGDGQLARSLRFDEFWKDEWTQFWRDTDPAGTRSGIAIRRAAAMGIVAFHAFGNFHWWLIQEKLARAAQRPSLDPDELRMETEQAEDVDVKFSNLADHAGYLLRAAPRAITAQLGIATEDDDQDSWLRLIFGECVKCESVSVFKTETFPLFIPTNCQWDAKLGPLYKLGHNPFRVSAILIDTLVVDRGSSELQSANDLRDEWMYRSKKNGKTHGEIRAILKSDHSDWDQLESEQAVGRAIDRYCERNKLPLVRRKK